MNLKQMLDLPRGERSVYLCKIPLSSEYVFGALEEESLVLIRTTIHERGGIWRECYRYPGVFFQATFPDQASKRSCDESLISMMNEGLRRYYAEYQPEVPEDRWSDELYTFEWIKTCVTPALEYEQDVATSKSEPREQRFYRRPFGLKLNRRGTWQMTPVRVIREETANV